MPDVDLTTLHDRIVTRLSSDMVATTVAAYPELPRKIDIPAVLIDLDDVDVADFGDGDRLGLLASFTAYCITDPSQANAEMIVRNLAVTVALRIFQEDDFGADVSRGAEIIRIGPDNLQPELEGYRVWSVAFEVGIEVGEDAYLADPADGVHVTTITIGDLNTVDISHVMADGNEPTAEDEISLPETPKG
nr:hypothetical protein 12 [Gammaproteobacteria bacterium]